MNDRGSISGRRRQEMFYNVTLRFVRVTAVEVENQQVLHIPSVCL
jgi:hypothetical protein